MISVFVATLRLFFCQINIFNTIRSGNIPCFIYQAQPQSWPTIGPSSSICCNATFLSFFLTRKSRWSLGGLKKWRRDFCNDGVDEYHLSIGELSPGF